MHLHNDVDSGYYAETLLKIDEGYLETDAEGYILLSREFCILIENDAQVYPDLKQNLNSDQWLCPNAILAPRNNIVNSINNEILKDVHVISNLPLEIIGS